MTDRSTVNMTWKEIEIPGYEDPLLELMHRWCEIQRLKQIRESFFTVHQTLKNLSNNNQRATNYYKDLLDKLFTQMVSTGRFIGFGDPPDVEIVYARTEKHAFGLTYKDGGYGLPWENSKEDMRHFADLTTGHAVIMGRKTFESLNKTALPNRLNIVVGSLNGIRPLISRGSFYLVPSFKEAINVCKQHNFPKVFVIGGARLIREAMPMAKMVHETVFTQEPREDIGEITRLDVNFNLYSEFDLIKQKPLESGEGCFKTYERKENGD